MRKRTSTLEVQLKSVGMKLEEHRGVIKHREELAVQKAEMARKLLEEIKQGEMDMERDELDFVSTIESSVETSVQTTSVESVETSSQSSQSMKSMSYSEANSR